MLTNGLLYKMNMWINSDLHYYLTHEMPALYVRITSLAADFFVVFVIISPLFLWLLLVHVVYSRMQSQVDVVLLLIRTASCLAMTFAVIVLLNEFFSRRAMIALGVMIYGLLGLLYSWIVPIYKWYHAKLCAKGIVTFLPQFMRELLLKTSLIEWLTDTSFTDKLAPYLPFLLPLSRAEQMKMLEQLPPESQLMMTRPGLLPLLPSSIQKILLPKSIDCDSEVDGTQISDMTLVKQESEENCKRQMQPSTHLALHSTSGFDFHRPNVVQTIHGPISRDQVLHDIMTSKMWNLCKIIFIKLPTARMLHRTAAISSALLVMQLYASKNSRKAFVIFVHFIASSALSSVACFALFLRFVQLLDMKTTVPLFRYAKHFLLQSVKFNTLTIANHSATEKTMRIAASSVSIVIAALYVIRKMR
ncbi:hypothetical protein Plhal703r1_c03g0016171 [Plasmopara halstedii]